MPQPSRPAARLKATWSATIYVLGLIGSAMAVAAMIERGFGLDLFGIPRAILAEYGRYRDFIFSLAPFQVPAWLKDGLVAYFAVGAAHLRAYPREMIDSTSLVLILYLTWPITLVTSMLDIKDGYQARKAVGLVTAWLTNLAFIVAAAVSFFAWNYLSK
jgi:hypothetical protein